MNASGDVVVVGAPGFDLSAGTARVYEFSSSNEWTQRVLLDMSGISSGELAGWSCDINAVGDRVLLVPRF